MHACMRMRCNPNIWPEHCLSSYTRAQLFKYRTKLEGVGMTGDMFGEVETADYAAWWRQYGLACPQLLEVARMCSAPASAAGGERVFSALSNQWSKKRASMLMGRAAMLTYIYFNGRVMDRSNAASADDWEAFYEYLQQQEPREEAEAEGQAIDLATMDVVAAEGTEPEQ
jgi:hypothetical protein